MLNPHASYLVRASAGSGKTFQLSRRFLHLVAAHAPPGSILTVTFTNKAAAEMRERIIAEAARLSGRTCDETGSTDPAFDEEALRFWRESGGADVWPRPLSAREVGEKILGQTQSLAITTIDALYYDWVQYLPQYKGADLIDPLLGLALQRHVCLDSAGRTGPVPETMKVS